MASPLSTPTREPTRDNRAPGTRSVGMLARHASEPGAPPPRRRWILVGVAALLAANVGVAMAALVVNGDGSSGAPRSAPAHSLAHSPTNSSANSPSNSSAAQIAPATIASAVRWMATWLPKDVDVLADNRVSSQLRAAGFSAIRTPADGAPADGIVVATRQLRASTAQDSATAAAVRSAIPLAVIGSGTDEVTVAQVSHVSSPQLAAHRAADASLRRSSEPELLGNPSIAVDSAAATVLRGGGLDLRAATVIAQLAATGRLTVRAIEVENAELRAALPARVIVLADTLTPSQTAYLKSLTGSYRPLTWAPTSDGGLRLVWPLRADPTDNQR